MNSFVIHVLLMVPYAATLQSLFAAIPERFLITKEECTEFSFGAWSFTKEGSFFNTWASLIQVFRNGCASWTQYLVHMILMNVRVCVCVFWCFLTVHR